MLQVRTGYQAWISDPRRARSPEVDFGVWWRLGKQNWPQWRVSWIEATGELYARELELDSDRYIILGTFATLEEVQARMAGWAEAELGLKDLNEWFG